MPPGHPEQVPGFAVSGQSLDQGLCGIQTGLRQGRALGPGLEVAGVTSAPTPSICTQTPGCTQVRGAGRGGLAVLPEEKGQQLGLQTGSHCPRRD